MGHKSNFQTDHSKSRYHDGFVQRSPGSIERKLWKVFWRTKWKVSSRFTLAPNDTSSPLQNYLSTNAPLSRNENQTNEQQRPSTPTSSPERDIKESKLPTDKVDYILFVETFKEPHVDSSVTDAKKRRLLFNELLKEDVSALLYKHGVTCTVTFKWCDTLKQCIKLRGYCISKKSSDADCPKEHDRKLASQKQQFKYRRTYQKKLFISTFGRFKAHWEGCWGKNMRKMNHIYRMRRIVTI